MPFPLFKKKKSINIRVSTLAADLEFTVASDVKAQVVFDQTCRTIGLRETWYFGLAFNDIRKRFQWIKLDKRLVNHAIPKPVNGEKLELRFLAKFFPESMEDELIQEVTRHHFFLQIQHLILSQDLYCPPEASVLLASYAVQAKYGDYDPEIHTPGFMDINDFLPKRVIDQFQMSEEMWEEKITSWYTEHRGLTCDEAEMEYLKIAQDLEMCGVQYFTIKNRKGTSLWLGINAVSVSVYEKENQLHPIVSFQWSELSDMSFKDNKFTIKQNPSSRSATLRRTQSTATDDSAAAGVIDMNKNDFIFFTDEPGDNKLILDLCRGNHDLFMQRRKVDSMEIQQMKSQAREERARKQMERSRQKDERDKILMEKEELERKLKELQDESKAALDALSRSEETAELLAEKAKVAEEEAMLLKRKANHSEQEMQRVKAEFAKTQEANIQLQQKLQNYDLMTHQLREESRVKSSEADNLRDELRKAKQQQVEAKEKLSQIANSSHPSSQETNSATSYMYSNSSGPLMTSTPANTGVPPANPNFHNHNGSASNGNSTQITSHHLSLVQSVTVAPLTTNGSLPAYSSGGAAAVYSSATSGDLTNSPQNQLSTNYMQQLTQEIEKERVEYQAKSRHIEQQLAALKSEIEDLKVDEKMTPFDHLHTENSLKGGSKFSTVNKSQESTPQQRLQFYDDL